ncbi:general stress protein [Brachybacterium sp. FME24]|uniref:general stress protein n=1 Tax=Brachybacterium sp. FME24 TaxID=2742605 RepID=UPI001D0235E6|nr:general stress protein [Brachybacterium sp. FME24]
MTQPPQASSPLTARLYDLEYPRSLGVYSTYQEVQTVVDTLADSHFPVQSTLIVGTDLKLMERVTGRKTWGRVIGKGVVSGLWMGLFLGLLLTLITPGNLMIVVTSVLLGMVFFTVSAVIGYAMTGGKRDFTSMTATIPMQYELLVEHKHADQARRLLAETGAAPVPAPVPPATSLPGHGGASPYDGGLGHSPSTGPQQQFGQRPSAPNSPSQPLTSPHSAAPSPAPQQGRPSYGQPAPTSAWQESPDRGQPRSGRPTFGQPAATPTSASRGEDSRPHDDSSETPRDPDAGGR